MVRSHPISWTFIISYALFIVLILISLSAVPWPIQDYSTIALVFILLGSATVLNEYGNPEDNWDFYLIFFVAIAGVCGILLLTILFSALFSFSTMQISLVLALFFTVGATFDLIVFNSSWFIFWGIVALTVIFYIITLSSMIEDKKSEYYWEWITFSLAIIALLVAFFVKREYGGRLTPQQIEQRRRALHIQEEQEERRFREQERIVLERKREEERYLQRREEDRRDSDRPQEEDRRRDEE